MKRRISIVLISSGTILLMLSMLLSTVSFAATGLVPQNSPASVPRAQVLPQEITPICSPSSPPECQGKPVGTQISERPCKICAADPGEGGPVVHCHIAMCHAPPCPAGEPCDDGNACTENDVCQADNETCAGTAITCDDGNVCTDDSCDPASGCVFTNNTDPCDDGDPCTEPDICTDGACVPGEWVCGECETDADCPDDDNVCTDPVCEAGTCGFTNNTDPCDDGNACTEPDICADGVCVPGEWVCGECETDADCDDLDPCTDDTCVDGGCQHEYICVPTPTPTPPPCPNATITVQVTECGAGVAGLSVELHSSYGDVYGPKTSPATFSVIGGSFRLWYAIVNGVRMGPTIEVTECEGTGTIGVVFDCVPTPTPVVEVLGVERLPVTGGMPLGPALPTLPMILSSLSLICSGLLLRRKE